jgi:hypothetical protein
VLKLPPSPRWSPSQGPSSWSGNSMDSPGPSPRASGSLVCLLANLSWTAPHRLHYQASGRTATGLVPFSTRWQPHHKLGWCGLTRLQAPPMYKHGARKHLWMRGMQTSLATRPKPRASADEHGLTNLSTSQSTYADHLVIFKLYASGEH